MPELPDVEDARRDLHKWLVGATVRAANCTDSRLTRPRPPAAFGRALVGKRVEAVERKGKWLRVVLSDGTRLFSHLGMTGQWTLETADAPSRRFERARVDVVRRGRLSSVRYLDARRFGRLVTTRDDIADWSALGPDPLGEPIDVGRLAEEFGKRKRSVKELLMDQSVLAGIGNILATEALWMARVDPRAAGHALAPADVRSIARSIRRVIARELATRTGEANDTESSLFVYGRAGKPCPRCGAALSRIQLGGRTTVFCKHCQVLRQRRPSVRKRAR